MHPRPIAPSSFYSLVMSTPVKSSKQGKQTSLPKAKLKGGGGGVRGKKLSGGGGEEAKNLWKIAFGADAGGGSSHKGPDFFDIHLSPLSKKQLTKLMRKIDALRAQLDENSEIREHLDKVAYYTRQSMDRRMQQSKVLVEELKLEITQGFKNLCNFQADPDTVAVQCFNRRIPIEQLVKKHFGRFVAQYNDYVSKGKIIPPSHSFTGYHFVRRCLVDFIRG